MKKLSLKILALHLLFSIAIAATVSYFSGYSFWLSFLVAEVSVLLNGFIAGSGVRSDSKKSSGERDG